jgi:hypothetical protein
VCGVLARGTNPAMTTDEVNEPAPERAAKGVLQGYLTAKTVQWTVRLTMWALPFLVIAAYGAVAWWRARRAVLAGALDAEAAAEGEPSPSVVARDEGVVGWIKS